MIESYAVIISDITCGTHVHVSPGDSKWTLEQVKNVSRSVIYFEEAFEVLLPPERRGNRECRSNRIDNPKLKHLPDLEACFQKIQECTTIKALIHLMNAKEEDSFPVCEESTGEIAVTERCYGVATQGVPPIWDPPGIGPVLKPDTGSSYIDQNADRTPGSPLQALIRAVVHTCQPGFDFINVNIVTDRIPCQDGTRKRKYGTEDTPELTGSPTARRIALKPIFRTLGKTAGFIKDGRLATTASTTAYDGTRKRKFDAEDAPELTDSPPARRRGLSSVFRTPGQTVAPIKEEEPSLKVKGDPVDSEMAM
ncbi:MAG: hypothetical protein Q9175_005937 [Cornicularia normoerica]